MSTLSMQSIQPLDRFDAIAEPCELLEIGRSISNFFQTVHIKPIELKTERNTLHYSTKLLEYLHNRFKQEEFHWNVYPVAETEYSSTCARPCPKLY